MDRVVWGMILALTGSAACNGDPGGGSSDGTGGGDGSSCALAADCPPSPDVCQRSICLNGTCTTEAVEQGGPLVVQSLADCLRLECDGSGSVLSVADPLDLPDDDNPCTDDLCDGSSPQHLLKPSGTSCGEGLVCDGAGACVGCASTMQCPGVDTECGWRTCIGGVCGLAFAPAATPLSNQSPGNCLRGVCDGQGHVVAEPDDTDIPPDDGHECTQEACSDGVALGPSPAGTPCSEAGGVVCDGAGECVGRERGMACAADNECDSGFCAGEICCDSSCDEACFSCDFARTGVASGTCAPALSGMECASGGCASGVLEKPSLCDGAGTCLPGATTQCPSGACDASATQCEGCADDSECSAGQACAHGVCCGTACGTCMSCGADLLSCVPADAGTNRAGECPASQPCNGTGACSGEQVFGFGYAPSQYDFPFGVHATEPGVTVNSAGEVAVTWANQDGCFWYCPSAVTRIAKVGSYERTAYGLNNYYTGAEPTESAVTIDTSGSVYFSALVGQPTFSLDGVSISANAGGSLDAVLLKLNPGGELVWIRTFGDTDPSALIKAFRVAASPSSGGVVVIGALNRPADLGGGMLPAQPFLARFDGDGNHIFSLTLPAVGPPPNTDVYTTLHATVDGAEDIIVGGSFNGTADFGLATLTSAGGHDLFLLKLEGATGSPIWLIHEGGGSDDRVSSLAADQSGAILLAGEGETDLGLGSASGPFLTRLAPDGLGMWRLPVATPVRGANMDWWTGNVAILGCYPAGSNCEYTVPQLMPQQLAVSLLDENGAPVYSRPAFGANGPGGVQPGTVATWGDGAIVASARSVWQVYYGTGWTNPPAPGWNTANAAFAGFAR